VLTFHKILVANTGEDSLTLKDGYNFKTIFLSKLIEEKEDNSTQENNQLGPYDIDIGEEGYIYIANSYDNSIMKLDIENIKLLEFIKVGRNPTCIKRFKGKIYVANSDSNSISIIDENTFSLIEDISVGERPTDIQIDEDSLKVFIANGNCYTINVLDLNNEKISSITLSKQPVKMAIEDKRLFVLSYINNGVTNYSNLSELEIEDYKTMMSIDLKGIFANFVKIKGKEVFYLSNVEDGYIYRVFINDEVNISKIYLGGMPNNIKWDGKTKLYISNILNDDLTIIDESNNQIIENIRVGKEPNGILLL
jgi:YVTN family beta-propeller protein